MQSLTKPLRDIGFLTIALTIALAANFAYGQWADPPATPPEQNVAAPVNVGDEAQSKTGTLGVGNLNVVEKVKTSIYSGQVWSPEYCDGNGENCTNIANIGISGGSCTTDTKHVEDYCPAGYTMTGQTGPVVESGVGESAVVKNYKICQKTTCEAETSEGLALRLGQVLPAPSASELSDVCPNMAPSDLIGRGFNFKDEKLYMTYAYVKGGRYGARACAYTYLRCTAGYDGDNFIRFSRNYNPFLYSICNAP